MKISTNTRNKIVNEIASWQDIKLVLEKFSSMWVTYRIIKDFISKSTKCRVFLKDWKLYRKCIYCDHPKELNNENFNYCASRKYWFSGICKYHIRIKKRNWRIINKDKYLNDHNIEQKRFYKNHIEEMKKKQKLYYENNKTVINRKSVIQKRKQRAKALQEKILIARNNS